LVSNQDLTSKKQPNFDKSDIVCTDGVYGTSWARSRGLKVCIPHRKPRDRKFTTGEVKENDEISEFRGDIERVFGGRATKYQWFKSHGTIFQGKEEFLLWEVKRGTKSNSEMHFSSSDFES
jgi:hypothetical protein